MIELNKEIITEEKRELLKPYHRVFQGIVSLIGNLEFSVLNTGLIFKCEGGVNINRKEIVIYEDFVKDDFVQASIKSKEEKIVVKLIERIFSEIDFNNIPDSLEEWTNNEIIKRINKELSKFVSNPYGDPLRSLFDI